MANWIDLERVPALLQPDQCVYVGGSANFFGVASATRAAEAHPGLVPS